MTPVTIVVTTWFPPDTAQERTHAVCRTLESWEKYLHYRGQLTVHLADDGSKPEHSPDWSRLISRFPISSISWQDRQGVGASLNAGFREAFRESPIVLYAVDDWALTEDFDLDPWVNTLIQESWIGSIRLGPPHPNIRGRVQMLPDGWGLVLDRYGYAFSFRPALYHERFYQAYGPFPEHCSALHSEQQYNEFYAATPGPEIILALPHPWEHIYSVELSAVVP